MARTMICTGLQRRLNSGSWVWASSISCSWDMRAVAVCGPMPQARRTLSHEPLSPGDFIGKWISLIGAAAARVDKIEAPVEDHVERLALASIVQGLANLRSFPWIAERERQGKLESSWRLLRNSEGKFACARRGSRALRTHCGRRPSRRPRAVRIIARALSHAQPDLLRLFRRGYRSDINAGGQGQLSSPSGRRLPCEDRPPFAAGFGSQLVILRKTALVIGNASATLARDFPLLLNVHGRKTPIRGVILLSHGSDPGSSSPELTVNSNKGSIVSQRSSSFAKGSICAPVSPNWTKIDVSDGFPGQSPGQKGRFPHGFD